MRLSARRALLWFGAGGGVALALLVQPARSSPSAVCPQLPLRPAATWASASTLLGTPIHSSLTLDSVLGRDANGNTVLYTATYAAQPGGGNLVVVDPENGTVLNTFPIGVSYGPYELAAAPDGTIYIASLQPAYVHLWAYYPDLGIVEDLGSTGVTGTYTFSVTVAPWGKVYVGTHTPGQLVEYDPAARSFRTLTSFGGDYGKAILPLPDGRLLLGGGSPGILKIYDRTTGQSTSILPAQYQSEPFVYNLYLAEGIVFARLAPSGRLLMFSASDLSFLGEVPEPAGVDSWDGEVISAGPGEAYLVSGKYTSLWRFRISDRSLVRVAAPAHASVLLHYTDPRDGHDWLIGTGSDRTFWRYDPATGQELVRQLAVPGVAAQVTALSRGPDGRIYGGTYETNGLFAYDPASFPASFGVVDYGNVAVGRTGEILALASDASRLHIISYIEAILTEYDPRLPWNPGPIAGVSNPVELGKMGADQNRPWDIDVDDGGQVWVATWANYGAIGGAVSRYDPETRTIASYRPSPNQNMYALATCGDEIFAGTTNAGDDAGGTGDARLIVLDRTTGATLYQATFPGMSQIDALARGSDGLIYGSVSDGLPVQGKLFSFDPATHAVTTFGSTGANQLIRADDGRIVGMTVGSVFVIDPATHQQIPIAPTCDGAPLITQVRTLAQDRAGDLYVACNTEMYRIERVAVGDGTPSATNDAASVPRGGSADIDVLANDTDPDDDPLWIDSFSQPAHGTVEQRFDGSLRYRNDGSAGPADSFTYRISDGRGGTSTATVGITVSNPTSVAASGFRAVRTGHDVVLYWRKADPRVLGFHVFRGQRRLDRTLLTGDRFVDRAVPQARRLRYRLQAVHGDGSLTWAGTARP